MRVPSSARPVDYLWAVLACLATTLVATPLLGVVDLANIVMLFLLTVALVAVVLGGGPAVTAAFASVALFDFFFVPPRLSMAVHDAEYLITFAVMLAVALLIGRLTAHLRGERDAAAQREARTAALYEMARRLAGALQPEQVAEELRAYLADQLEVTATLYLPGSDGALAAVAAAGEAPVVDGAVMAAYAGGEAALTIAGNGLALPLRSPLCTRGVLLVTAPEPTMLHFQEGRRHLEAVASLAAIAVERQHFSAVAQQAMLDMESERLRSALLSAVSHDLRTPLTVLVGLADSLCLAQPPLPPRQAEQAAAVHGEALRLSELVHNLLDMARLQVGKPSLHKEWQPLEEVVGSSLNQLAGVLAGRDIRLRLAADLPLLEFDAVLMERVFCNLLDNAAKYAPAGPILIEAARDGDRVRVAVADAGPGLAPGSEEAIFGLFARGRTTGSGAGLGLAICRVIVEAHGGSIRAENVPGGGARFVFDLPVGQPPVVEEDTP